MFTFSNRFLAVKMAFLAVKFGFIAYNFHRLPSNNRGKSKQCDSSVNHLARRCKKDSNFYHPFSNGRIALPSTYSTAYDNHDNNCK